MADTVATEDVHPGVEEIKPYVSVGPTKDLSVTVHKETFDTAFIIFTIIFGLAILVIIGLTIYFAYQQSKLPPPPPPLVPLKQDPTLHSNLGSAITSTSIIGKNLNFPEDASGLNNKSTCESVPNTRWTNNHCACIPPFFGPTCSREKHSNKYYAVGIPDERTLGITILDETTSQGKSFNKNNSNESCSNYCDNNPNCVGFIYHPTPDFNTGMCTLLTNDVIVPKGSGISYSTDIDSTLYMKSSDNLQFVDRIFLGEFMRSLPPRYWLVRETPHYKQLLLNEITTVNFVPTYTKIYGTHTGIYCSHPFSMSDIDIILQRGDTSECYIHQSGTEISIPPDWKYKTPLHIVYV